MPSFPEPIELRTEAVALRLAADRDIPEVLIAHQDDPDLARRLGLVRPPSGAELGRRVEGGPADRASGSGLWLTIVAAGDDECIGQVNVHNVDWDHARAELGIWTAPAHRGRGVAAAALRLVGTWLLSECAMARVQLMTEPDNAAMIAAALAAGFAQEGVLRGYLRERGQRVDIVMLSLVAADVVVVSA
ncbi:MAG TPA: GNAT family N-acetyltransferase [Solirubrobacteraceae bacterium]|nr:GNAT family N-acetyltransferase [Solirubrobacteraceae bacterium]